MGFTVIMMIGILFVINYVNYSSNSNDIEIKNADNNINNNSNYGCVNDMDCIRGGCSGQLCLTKNDSLDIITTCEWRDEYACFQVDNCLCIDNVCKWEENYDYFECLNNI